jgi:hypothetical protein
MELVLKLVVPTVQNIPDQSIISCRNLWFYNAVGFMNLEGHNNAYLLS